MRTSSNFPLCVFTIRTQEPNGKFGCAAVSASELNLSPLAVFLPSNSGPYQLALPTHTFIGLTGALRCATRGASMTGQMRNISGNQRMAAQAMKSGRRIVCSFRYETTKKCITITALCQPFSLRNLSFISLKDNALTSFKAFGRLPIMPSLAFGSAKLAVPTCTADAPTLKY